jgi:hypothetical protein
MCGRKVERCKKKVWMRRGRLEKFFYVDKNRVMEPKKVNTLLKIIASFSDIFAL